jgi:hypothetical protein
MTLTVRLEPRLERLLDRYCRKHRLTRTEVITDLLERYVADEGKPRPSAYGLAKEAGLIGAFASGKDDTAQNHKRYLREKLRAKHAR